MYLNYGSLTYSLTVGTESSNAFFQTLNHPSTAKFSNWQEIKCLTH